MIREITLDADLFPPFEGFPRAAITFLKQLRKNNTRPWFAKHKDEYEEYLKLPMHSLIAALRPGVTKFAPEIEVNPRRSMFRIYRDIRFSKNKSPYKTHVAAVFHPKGHWQEGAGFYLHIEPGEVYIGGGIYMPVSAQLKKIRASIADQPRKFLTIITDDTFEKRFGSLEGEKLQRMPLGFPSDHMMREWLKYKSFLAGVSLKEATCYTPKLIRTVEEIFRDLHPLVRFLNDALHS